MKVKHLDSKGVSDTLCAALHKSKLLALAYAKLGDDQIDWRVFGLRVTWETVTSE